MKTMTDADIDTLCEYLQGLKGRGIRFATSGHTDTYSIDHGTFIETRPLASKVVLEIEIPPAPKAEPKVDNIPKLGQVFSHKASSDRTHTVWTVYTDGKWTATEDSKPSEPSSSVCPDCNGTKVYRGLLSEEPCRRCSQ